MDRRWALAAVALTMAFPCACAFGDVPVSEFESRGLDGWRARSFQGETVYRVVDGGGRRVLEARAEASASGVYRTLEVDLASTPNLAWSWWIDAPVSVSNVRERGGDDFAARVYVLFSGGLRFWRTTSLVYVWGDVAAPAEPWSNPFTAQAAMFALRRGGGGCWHTEQRDLAADYQRAFGRRPPRVIAVAIMTDTDQTGASALARYSALRFVAPGAVPRVPDGLRRCVEGTS